MKESKPIEKEDWIYKLIINTEAKNMREISVQELKEKISNDKNTNFLLLDVRTAGEYKSEFISGSQNIPKSEIEKHLDDLKKYEIVYAYCVSGERSSSCCRKLEEIGVTNVVNVKGGINEWKSAGFEVIKGKGGSISIVRQVHIVVSLLIILTSILAKTVNVNFVFLSILFCLGLLSSGLFNVCLMAKILEKMPWNR